VLLLLLPAALQLESVLVQSTSLEGRFDAMELHEASSGHPLSAMGYWALVQSGLVQELHLSSAVLVKSVTSCCISQELALLT
jgi:hypothetical protein